MGTTSPPRFHVVVFSGGRGSTALIGQLARRPEVSLSLAINGYDDGRSTGEVRRFLGDSLGPSDFRKNASRLAEAWRTASPAVIELLDWRLPDDTTPTEAQAWVEALRRRGEPPPRLAACAAIARRVDPPDLHAIAERIGRFEDERLSSRRAFRFGDCAVGNLVFAGGYLACGRAFNAAVDDYVALLGLPAGAIENVTDGTNAHLVALDVDGLVLGSEEAIVDAKRRNRIRDIFLIERPLTPDECARLSNAAPEVVDPFFARLSVEAPLNPRLQTRIREADLIVYAPGTQHSSLFPSYLTVGLSDALALNLTATKLLITNIHTDAEIAGASAVEIVERAVHYLKAKGRASVPTPCLITHYLLNDPVMAQRTSGYVPLGHLESLEDPRLVRMGLYEDGLSGRHDAARVLQPFINSPLPRTRALKVAVLLQDAGSPNKAAESILEMIRSGLQELSLELTFFYDLDPPLDARFVASVPFAVRNLAGGRPGDADVRLKSALEQDHFDYLVLFESSGTYRGEDLIGLLTHLRGDQLDAVWGSRRLSVRDIEASYRLRYRDNLVIGAVSFIGSHLLSLSYLLAYGRYVSDTLSAVRVVRAADACRAAVPLTDRRINEHLLTTLLRRKAELLELPVRFFPLSPDRVRRTTVWEGLRALGFIVWRRLRLAKE